MTEINSPFGASAPVNVYAGSCDSAPCMMVIWQRISDGACATSIVGNGSGLFDDYQLYGSSGADFMAVMPTTLCGFKIDDLYYNGHYLDLYGRQGNDNLFMYSSGETWFFGEEGNDFLFYYGAGRLDGGDGNDTLEAMGAFSTEQLYGGNGSDVIYDFTATASDVDCGPGGDTLISGIGGYYPRNVNCETFK